MSEAIFVSVETAAEALEMKPFQIWRAIREGKFPFPFVKIGKYIRIDARAIGLAPAWPEGEGLDGAKEGDLLRENTAKDTGSAPTQAKA